MRYWPSSTPSDNAETTHHQARAGVPFAEFTRGYPVLGITFRILVTCPPSEARSLLQQIQSLAAARGSIRRTGKT
jgi:hypothetical protein